MKQNMSKSGPEKLIKLQKQLSSEQEFEHSSTENALDIELVKLVEQFEHSNQALSDR
ncbi:hypothetical protein PUG81_09265 [Erwiniaceae bacterium L1_54_6]|jgi:hypothetical protein|nr:hypothetical protein [Erwiniaceae bacterium L1_54_6]